MDAVWIFSPRRHLGVGFKFSEDHPGNFGGAELLGFSSEFDFHVGIGIGPETTL